MGDSSDVPREGTSFPTDTDGDSSDFPTIPDIPTTPSFLHDQVSCSRLRFRTHIVPENKVKKPVGLCEDTLKKLKRMTFDDLSPKRRDDICIICQYTPRETQYDHELYIELGCDHVFCEECITKWLRTNTRCPLCKAEVKVPKEKEVPYLFEARKMKQHRSWGSTSNSVLRYFLTTGGYVFYFGKRADRDKALISLNKRNKLTKKSDETDFDLLRNMAKGWIKLGSLIKVGKYGRTIQIDTPTSSKGHRHYSLKFRDPDEAVEKAKELRKRRPQRGRRLLTNTGTRPHCGRKSPNSSEEVWTLG